MKEKKVKIIIKENGDIALKNHDGEISLLLGTSMIAFIKAATDCQLDDFRRVADSIYHQLNPRETPNQEEK